MILFYSKTRETPPLDTNVLKTSLSTTLSQFYPLAGRCNDDEFTISCNDQGIPLITTRVNCTLSDYLNSPNKIDLMHKFMPPQEIIAQPSTQRLPELPPLALQFNAFACGGAVLGCYKLHKVLLDGTSLSTFLKYWAAVASERYDSLVQPHLDSVVSTFPPRLYKDWLDPGQSLSLDDEPKAHVVAKSFIFSKDAINDLRASATSEEVPKPSRFVALASFVWKHCMAAADAARELPMGPEPSVMQVLVNLRPRIDPPLPKTSLGNLITTVSARGSVDMELADLVRGIQAAVLNVQQRVEIYKGENAVQGLIADIGPLSPYRPAHYVLSSWCQFGLDEVDFGLGKPIWASPTNGLVGPTARNFLHFTTDTSGEGIEAWFELQEKEMRFLVSNQEFLAFATPN